MMCQQLQQWSTYDATETWEDAVNLGLGEIDQPGLYTMSSQSNVTDTIYNVVSDIATSAFGYIYEDNAGNIGYADADHRQNYLLVNGYVELDARHALGAGLSTIMRSADVRNDIYLNYGTITISKLMPQMQLLLPYMATKPKRLTLGFMELLMLRLLPTDT
jgi:hypothetical protein